MIDGIANYISNIHYRHIFSGNRYGNVNQINLGVAMQTIIVEIESSFKISANTVKDALHNLFGDASITVKEIPDLQAQLAETIAKLKRSNEALREAMDRVIELQEGIIKFLGLEQHNNQIDGLPCPAEEVGE